MACSSCAKRRAAAMAALETNVTVQPQPGNYVVKDSHGIVVEVYPAEHYTAAAARVNSVPGYTLTFQA